MLIRNDWKAAGLMSTLVCFGLVLTLGGCGTSQTQTSGTLDVAPPAAAVAKAEPTGKLSGVFEKVGGDTMPVIRFIFQDDTLIALGMDKSRYGGLAGVCALTCDQSTAGRLSCTIRQFKDLADDPPPGHYFTMYYKLNADGSFNVTSVYDAPEYLEGTWKPVAKW